MLVGCALVAGMECHGAAVALVPFGVEVKEAVIR